MKLNDVLNSLSNSSFLLTVDGVCSEWYGGADKLKEAPYYGMYRDRKVKSMSVLLTNGMPELHIRLWEV